MNFSAKHSNRTSLAHNLSRRGGVERKKLAHTLISSGPLARVQPAVCVRL
jgi:hypothetical protein